MTETTIRKITGEELKLAFYELATYSFQSTPPMPERAKYMDEFKEEPGEHCWAAYEDGRPAAVLGYTAMTQNVRGRLVEMGGVWGVSSAPETRRKGYVRQAMAAGYADMRALGMPVSGLYPFRESFYERLGYATFMAPKRAKLKTAALAPLLKKDLGGRAERVTAAEGCGDYRAYIEDLRRRVHGMAFRDAGLEKRMQSNQFWLLRVKEDGAVTGVMLYKIAEEAKWEKVFQAERFYYQTPLARLRMLEWIARHVDQADRAEIYVPPFEYPETWMVDLQVKVESQHPPMGRVVDVAALNGTPCGEGSFTLQVTDPFCPWNEGAWRFESDGCALRVERAGAAADRLSIQGLSAWLYGSIPPAEYAARGWGDLSPETAAAMRSVLPPQTPFMHEFY